MRGVWSGKRNVEDADTVDSLSDLCHQRELIDRRTQPEVDLLHSLEVVLSTFLSQSSL